MGRLFAIVVAAGILIGLAWPSGKSPARASEKPSGGRHEVTLTRGSTGHFFTDADVNGKGSIEFIVDTGASIVALGLEDARRLGSRWIPPISRLWAKVRAGRSAANM